jgi:hypothetical protein
MNKKTKFFFIRTTYTGDADIFEMTKINIDILLLMIEKKRRHTPVFALFVNK